MASHQDPDDLERIVHVPRLVRIVLGLVIALFGALLLLVGVVMVLMKPDQLRRDLVLASVVISLLAVIALTCIYVGARLIVLQSDREPLLRRRASRALAGGLALVGVAALAAAIVGDAHRPWHAALAALFLPIAWFVHTRQAVKASE